MHTCARKKHVANCRLKSEIQFASDIDNFAKQSYFANYEIAESNWYNDVHDIDGKKYKGKLDLLVGGSPCQSFSRPD